MIAILTGDDSSLQSREAFRRLHEDPCIPCLIQGKIRDWPCYRNNLWSPEILAARFPSHAWDLGLESHERMMLPAFLERKETSASQEYIFDASFGEDFPQLLEEYESPSIFPADDHFMKHLSSMPSLRPDWRWFLIGRAGSGFTIHQDPTLTSAWNALVSGRKRWVMIDPKTVKIDSIFPSRKATTPDEGVGGGSMPFAETEKTARAWIENILPLLATARDLDQHCAVKSSSESSDAASSSSSFTSSASSSNSSTGLSSESHSDPPLREPPIVIYDFVQEAGDIVFIPTGWWHVALTISPTSSAVTHNYVGEAEFTRAYKEGLRGAEGGGFSQELMKSWKERVTSAGLLTSTEY